MALIFGIIFFLIVIVPTLAGGPRESIERSNNFDANRLLDQANAAYEVFVRLDQGRTGNQPLAPDAQQALREAVDLLNAYIAAVGFRSASEADRLRQWERALQDVEAAELAAIVQTKENEHRDLLQAQDFEGARRALEEALEVQRQIAVQYSQSRYHNPGRVLGFERRLQTLAVEPMGAQVIRLERNAQIAIQEGRWEDATAFFDEAIRLQSELMEDFPGSRQANASNLRRLQSGRDSLTSGRVLSQINFLIQEGRTLMANNSFADAAEAFRQARRELDRYEAEYTGRDFPFVEKNQILSRLEQTALSQPSYERIQRQWEMVMVSLRSRRFEEAAATLERTRDQLFTIQRDYARSEFLSQLPSEGILYLWQNRSALPALHETVDGLLVNHPLNPDLKIFSREVSQQLYRQIMGANPSRSQQPENPVESITWQEASEFARRLSWVYGHPFRVPYRPDIEPLIRDFIAANAAPSTFWSLETSGGEVRAVATSVSPGHGIFDLVGNVAEWITVEDDQTMAYSIGGHVRMPSTILSRSPVIEPHGRQERNRLVGFRLVKEFRKEL
jgi:tetratricopeptide (TPR) repeat protein